MRKLFRENKSILILYLVVSVILGIILIVYTKEEIHLWINSHHSKVADIFFRYITYLGDGWTVVIITAIFLFISFKMSLTIGFSGILSGMLAQFFKRLIFEDVLRPVPHFRSIADLYLVPGINIHSIHSLPSGHTAAAFALFFVLATFTSNKLIKLTLMIVAYLIAFSRIYLSQHFLIDIFFGAFLGLMSAIVVVLIMERSDKKWLNNSLITIKR